MNASDYQKQAARTLITEPDRRIPGEELAMAWNALVLGGEFGEVAEHVKKGVFHQHGVKPFKVGYILSGISSKCDRLFGGPFLPFRPLTGPEIMLIWVAIGIIGEAGEVASLIVHSIIGRQLDKKLLTKELGDLCWYVAGLCTLAGIDLGEAMQGNIQKLMTRYPDGYKAEDSQKRIDVEAAK